MRGKTINLYLPEYDYGYVNWLLPIFSKDNIKVDVRKLPSSKHENILVLTGGEDISPRMYGSTNDSCFKLNTKRDHHDWNALSFADRHNIPVIGICRGAQMCAVYNKHRLVQHATGHMEEHKITFMDGEEYMMTSSHHQMMLLKPYKRTYSNYVMLAWSTKAQSKIYMPDQMREPEIVYFPDTHQLAIQGHPERLDQSSALIKKLQFIVTDMMKTDNFGVWI